MATINSKSCSKKTSRSLRDYRHHGARVKVVTQLLGMLIWVLVFELISYGLGTLTHSSITHWYAFLQKSSLTPPALTFPIVWSILYLMIALSGWSLWQHRDQIKAKQALGFYSAQMILNWAWSPLFFNFHQIALSFLCIVLMISFTLVTILLTRHRFKFSSIMLVPYCLWLGFAGYLNGMLWMLN